ncbi:hypothetical protein D3C86_1082980 [compost metagenome]
MPHRVEFKVCDYTIGGIVDISVSFPEKPFKTVRGIKGRSTRVYNADRTCIITVNLLQTTTSNYIFSDLLTNDIARNNVRLNVLLRDLEGGSVLQSEQAFITAYPDFGFSDELQNRTWVIECLDYTKVGVEGNSKSAPDLLGGALNEATKFVNNLIG